MIHLPLKKLSHWQKVAFCAALLERMLPNYQLFAEAAGFGNYAVLRNQTDLIWQWLANNKSKINIEAQLAKLDEQIPDPDAFDFFGVYPAVDVGMALMATMQAMASRDNEDFIQVGHLSANSVSSYIELTADEDDQPMSSFMIKQHPLMAWEIATQNELYDLLKDAPESKATCERAKALVLEEGLSNLGIEF